MQVLRKGVKFLNACIVPTTCCSYPVHKLLIYILIFSKTIINNQPERSYSIVPTFCDSNAKIKISFICFYTSSDVISCTVKLKCNSHFPKTIYVTGTMSIYYNFKKNFIYYLYEEILQIKMLSHKKLTHEYIT